ncbi:replicative DNA helicase [Candidatus Uhrbacteria bacterium]|nr:replicative DNA helicase [Candidatus Uhrbacteria bacterium]
MDQPKIPPNSVETEQCLLGSILIEKDSILRVADLIHADDFYRQANGDIFQAMLDLFAKREPIDITTLSNRLLEKEQLEAVGGRSYLISLTSLVPTAAHIVSYATTVQKKATLRRLLSAASEITALGYEEADEVTEILDRAEQKLFGVSQKYLTKNFTPIKDALDDAFDRIDRLHQERGKLRGIPTGYPDLDDRLGGLQRSDLVILAARPSVGKTSLALDIARQSAVKHKITVGIFSLEMSKDQLVDRMICAEAGVDLWRMRTGRLSDKGDNGDFARIGHALGQLSEAPIFIDDTANMNITEIRTKARRLQMDHGLGLLIIDYLQLMESRQGNRRSDNRVQEVAEITRALKGLARELNIPVMALSQLSRTTENEKPAIPKLSHLRESGSIEQDADVVMFIYRKAADRNYRLDDISMEERHRAEIHIAKHRNGPTGQVNMFFDEQRACFRSLDKGSGRSAAAQEPAMAMTAQKTP